jgi:DNA-binding beta-propeller fold protein YncE
MKWQPIFISLFLFILTDLNAQSFELVWKTDAVFKVPESVYFDETRNQIYVSNINGKPTVKDNNGFISLLNTDGSIKKLKWITGMDAPKGMALNDSLLYVTDIGRFHIINVNTLKIIKTINVDGAEFLNDIALNPNGDIYISDMAKNRLHRFDGVKVEIWLTGDDLVSPNGLAFYKQFLYVGTQNSILKVDPVEKSVKVHITETGPVDGLIPLGGNKYVISDWSGRILIADFDTKIVLQNTTNQDIQAADLGYIPDEKLVLIPTFFNNRVVARRLP